MIQLHVDKVVHDVPPRMFKNVREYESRCGHWMVRFRDPYERSMGLLCWEVSLFQDGSDVTHEHESLTELSENFGFLVSDCDRPWCDNRPLLAVQSADGVLRVYDPEERDFRLQLDEWGIGNLWAPAENRLALLQLDTIKLYSPEEAELTAIHFRQIRDNLPVMFWWLDGKSLFVVHKTSRRAKPRISWFDGNDGRELQSLRFDPVKYLPYERDAYQSIARGRYSLQVSSSTLAVGRLLDDWKRIEFDEERTTLRCFVYRPSGPPTKQHGQVICQVTEKCVEIKITV